MRLRHWVPTAVLLFLPWVFAGCEGDEGPQGPAGPAGPTGPTGGSSEFTFVGRQGEPCQHCHFQNVTDWHGTNHEGATVDLGDSDENPYCLRCHTTGFDSQYAFNGTLISTGPDVNGYDDYLGVDTEFAAERRADLEGVQCEACHGPMGPDFNAHRPELSFSTHYEVVGTDTVSTSMCVPCHEGQIAEWAESGHSRAAGGDIDLFNEEHYATSGSCQPCHTSEGFIRANDPAYATYEFGDRMSFIGCPTCHDPHRGAESGGNEHQLRNLKPVEVAYDPVYDPGDPEMPRMEGYGVAQTCAQCHHGRRDRANVTGQIQNGTGNFGPHASPQMDTFIGHGCYEILGYTYEREHSHKNDVLEACVQCHMTRETEIHGELQDHSFHNMTPNVGNCLPCHDIPDFDYHGVQTAIQGKMDQLAQLLGFLDAADMVENFDSQAPGVTVWQREAAYALFFTYEDGSRGVHNPDYVNSLLDNAIDYAIDNGGGDRLAAR